MICSSAGLAGNADVKLNCSGERPAKQPGVEAASDVKGSVVVSFSTASIDFELLEDSVQQAFVLPISSVTSLAITASRTGAEGVTTVSRIDRTSGAVRVTDSTGNALSLSCQIARPLF